MNDLGYRISDLKSIPVTSSDDKLKNKIAFDNTYLLSYSHTVYGINYNKQNYKIPLTALRDDLKAYIGVESLVAPWSEQMKLWHGVWYDATSRNKSYTYVWKPEDFADAYYSPEKFSDLENSYYIIKDAPFPYESGELNNREKGEIEAIVLDDGTVKSVNLPIKAEDKYPESNKIVTKKYIDERLASKRIVEVSTEFTVRDYDCTYIIRSEELIKAEAAATPVTIKITFPEAYNARILHNKLAFDILLEGVKQDNVWKPAIVEDVNWEFYSSNSTLLNHVWLNNSTNQLPHVNNENLYGNAQYIIFRVESITDHIETSEIRENIAGVNVLTGHEATPIAEVYILCENSLYRAGDGIKYANDEMGDTLTIKSSDNTAIVGTELAGGEIIVDLKTDIRPKDNLVKIDKPTAAKKYWDVSIDTNKLPIIDISSKDNSIIIDDSTNSYDISINKDELPVIDITSNNDSITIDNSTNSYDLSINLDNLPKTQIEGDNTFIEASQRSSDNVWVISLDGDSIRPKKIMQPVPSLGTIELANSYDKQYYSSEPNLDLSFDPFGFPYNESININLFYKPTADGTISGYLNGSAAGDLKWAMNTESPIFKTNRLYSITFTYIPSFGDFLNTSRIIGRVNWFKDL